MTPASVPYLSLVPGTVQLLSLSCLVLLVLRASSGVLCNKLPRAWCEEVCSSGPVFRTFTVCCLSAALVSACPRAQASTNTPQRERVCHRTGALWVGNGGGGGQASVFFEPRLVLEPTSIWGCGLLVLFPGCSSFSPGPHVLAATQAPS